MAIRRQSTEPCLLLPIAVGGRRLRVLTYVIGGTAPLLFGRPILQQLGLSVDYGTQRMKWSQWISIPLGPKGEHLLDLTEDQGLILGMSEEDDVLTPADFQSHVNVMDHVGIHVFLDDDDILAVSGERDGASRESAHEVHSGGWTMVLQEGQEDAAGLEPTPHLFLDGVEPATQHSGTSSINEVSDNLNHNPDAVFHDMNHNPNSNHLNHNPDTVSNDMDHNPDAVSNDIGSGSRAQVANRVPGSL